MRWMKFLVLLLPLTMTAACDDATGSGDTGRAKVYLSASNSGAAAVMSLSADYLDGTMGALSPDNVDSLFVRVTAISLLRMSDDTADSSGGWITIALADSGLKRINVLNLPNEDSVLLATGELEAGTYKNLRLEFDSASIMLKNDVRVGNHDFQKGTAYTLRVPSGVIKVPLTSFTVGEDSVSTLNMEFRRQPSIANIVATGAGVLQMSPVLHVK